MARPTNDRIIGVLVIGLAILGLLWARCCWLQVVAAGRYRAIAAAQHEASTVLRARRGAILDREGHPLAVGILAPSVFANARQVAAKQDVARQLAHVVDRDARMIQRRLERDKGFVWIARQLDPAVVPTVLQLRDQGIGIQEELRRVYPHGTLAAPLLGFVDIDQRGLEGLELAFNGILQGQDGWRSSLRDAKGAVLLGPWPTETQP